MIVFECLFFSLARYRYLHSLSFQVLTIFRLFEYSTNVTGKLQKAGKKGNHTISAVKLQKQPFADVFQNRCS